MGTERDGNRDITIRSEQPRDAFAIAELHTLAFSEAPNSSVMAIVSLSRHERRFCSDLSLVAELDGRIVGHILFTPLGLRLGAKEILGVILSPLGVHPDFQGMGIGGALVEEGHRRARAHGAELAVVLGHPTYYPRFGYRKHMYGTAEVTLDAAALSTMPASEADVVCESNVLTERRVQPSDIPRLAKMWEYWYGETDLASLPGTSMIDWISPNKEVRSVMILRGAEAVGYVRYSAQDKGALRYFLALDENTASQAAAYLARKLREEAGETAPGMLRLPLHPAAPAVLRWSEKLKEHTIRNGNDAAPLVLQGTIKPWDAGMLYPLNDTNRRIADYCARVADRPETAGSVIWPVPFELC